MTAALTIEGLTVAGRLTDLSLEVRAGSVHALVGPNGAGKSTVLRCVLGLVAFSGRVRLGPGGLALVPQGFHHAPVLPMTVEDFLAAQRQTWPVCLGVRAAVRRRVAAALESVGLGGFGPRPLDALSGGELKRVLLANALEQDAALLLLDEPEAGLDAASFAWLGEALAAQRAKGRAMLWVSHDAGLVASLADDTTRLVGGRRG